MVPHFIHGTHTQRRPRELGATLTEVTVTSLLPSLAGMVLLPTTRQQDLADIEALGDVPSAES